MPARSDKPAGAGAGGALDNLLALLPREQVTLIAVATRDALDGLVAVAEWARELGISFGAHMPYTSSE